MTTIKILLQAKVLFFLAILFFTSCNGQSRPENQNVLTTVPLVSPSLGSNFNIFNNPILRIDDNIRGIFQDRNGHYWFGTNGQGVYRYDGKKLSQFTIKNGLANDQILSIQEDKSGNIWLGTGLFGVSKLDGNIFKTLTKKENLDAVSVIAGKWQKEPDDLWFPAGSGVFHQYADSFTYLPLEDQTQSDSKMPLNTPYMLSRHAVYSILKDKKGNIWFGTQAQGVARYDGKSIQWFTEKGLSGSAVLGLFEDKNGNIWFGNNGAGLFKYDGEKLINFTEEKGLGNPQFKISGKAGPGTLARVYAINEDNDGSLWIGTVDAGVWRYDGEKLTNLTTKNGLTSNAVNTIFKDKNGEMWFGTDANGIFKFNGKIFEKFEVR